MKKRIDQLLVEKGFFSSRTKAQAAIMAGLVFVDHQKVSKSGRLISLESEIEVRGEPCPYVSRGGIKLEHALKEFKVRPKGKICLDVGASTGGFTDCLLQKGAKKVYAVDVGYGQLAWKLRKDPRVIPMERTNIRYLTPEKFAGEKLELATIDVSFISLTKVLPSVCALLAEGGKIIALIKPQFEAPRGKVGKGGIVKDKKVHQEVIEKIIKFASQLNLKVKGITKSPITGADGNVEYFICLTPKRG